MAWTNTNEELLRLIEALQEILENIPGPGDLDL